MTIDYPATPCENKHMAPMAHDNVRLLVGGRQGYRQVFEEFWARQDGKCYSCGKELVKERTTLDHCHVTARLRGLCCKGCNRHLDGRPWKAKQDRWLPGGNW